VNANGERGELQARFDRHLRMLTGLGLSPERTAASLLSAGFATELVRTQFPNLPEAIFAPRPATRAEQRAKAAEALARSTPTGQGRATVLPPSAASIAQRVVTTIARSPSTNCPPPLTPTRAVAAATDLSEGISFQYVPLIQCSFPHADPGEQHQFTRRNGWLELTLSTARADVGLPYGVPARLLTIYCASEAVRTRSPEIFLGSSVHEFLRRLDVPITRGERGSLRVYANQLLRLIHCAISIDENIRDGRGRTGLHIRQALFVEEARLWWDEQAGVGQGSSLVLSPVLYDSILERSAPLSTKAIRELRKSPMDLDVYAWLAHRLFQLSRPSMVSWEQLSTQFGHDYAELRYFRRFFGDSLKRVLKAYPDAKLKWTDAGILLQPSRPHLERHAPANR
jgi:hypothetical protein